MIRRSILRQIEFLLGLIRHSRQAVRELVVHMKEIAGLNPGTELSREDVRVKLSALELSGLEFSLDEIIEAVERHLGLKIYLRDYLDLARGFVPDIELKAGDLAEVNCNKPRTECTIWVRQSLKYRPWPAYELSVFHELGHLLAGHHHKYQRHSLNPSTLRLDELHTEGQLDTETALEVEARKWAKALLLANSVPEIFEGEGTDRPT